MKLSVYSLFARVGYGDVEHKRERLPDHIGFDTGRMIEFAVFFKVYSNCLYIAGQNCLLKTLSQYAAKHFTAILFEKRMDGIEIFPV